MQAQVLHQAKSIVMSVVRKFHSADLHKTDGAVLFLPFLARDSVYVESGCKSSLKSLISLYQKKHLEQCSHFAKVKSKISTVAVRRRCPCSREIYFREMQII